MPDVRISELPAAASAGDADLAPLVQASGAALETRRATVAQLRNAVLADRGAHVRDFGAVGDGTTNDAPAIQAAIDSLKTRGGGTLSFGPRVYRIASPIRVDGVTIRFQGAGFTEGFGPGQGTWLRINTTGFTPFTFVGDLARGSAVRDIGVTQAQPAPAANWAPTNYDFVFRVEDCFGGVDFDNVLLANVTRGIYARNSGRLDIRRLRGQVFATGVEIDECYDVPRIHSLHFWTFWTSDNNVVRWQQANGDAMVFRRCDGVFVDQAFVLGYRSMFRFATTPSGVTTKFYIGQAYTDFVQYGVWLEGNGVDGQIANLTHQGEVFNGGGPPLAGGNGILVNASNTRVQVGNLRIDAVEDNAIRVFGSNNRIDVFSLRCVRYNYRNNGSAAIQLADTGGATPNAVYLGSPPLLELGNGGPLLNAGTNGILTTGTPAGRAARPGLSVGAADTGLFQPAGGTLAAAAGGAEVLRATTTAVTLGAAPGSHALEVATPAGGLNRVAVLGAGAGSGVTVAAQGADAHVDLWVTGKGSGLLRTPTPALADNSTAVATTAWVRAQGYGGGGAGPAPVTSVAGRAGDVTLTSADIGDFAAAVAAAAPVATVAGRTGAVTLAVADVAGAAPLASPALTGTPTAPTAAAGTSTTQLATTAFVWTKPPVAQLADNAATGGNARGAGAVDWQTTRSNAIHVASGAQAVVGGGQGNTASGTQALVAGGSGNQATATGAAVGGGTGNVAGGQNGAVAGGLGNAASGQFSWVPGGSFGSARSDIGRGAWASGRIAATGDAQAGEFVLYRQTTDATATRLTQGGAVPGANNTINLPNGGTYFLRLMVTARQTGGSAGTAGDSAGWLVTVLARRGASAAATAVVSVNGAAANVGGALAPGEADAAAAAWRLAVAADTTLGGLAITASGEAGKTIHWVARVLAVEAVG